MKGLRFTPLIILLCMTLQSCKEDGMPKQNIGTIEYYPSFLWVDEKTTPLEKTLTTEYSQDAHQDPASYADFAVIPDREANTPDLTLYVNGRECENGRFRLTPAEDSVNITISLPPGTEQGSYTYTLQLYDTDLNRVNNSVVSEEGDAVDIEYWIVEYDRMMNPLKRWLLIILLCIFSFLLLWFSVFRPIFFPHFSYPAKTISIKQGLVTIAAIHVNFKGAKEIIITGDSKPEHQSVLNRLFTGRTEYVTTNIQGSVIIKPGGKRRMFIIAIGYNVTPSIDPPMIGVVTIKNTTTTITIR